jgi:hypothetical protein
MYFAKFMVSFFLKKKHLKKNLRRAMLYVTGKKYKKDNKCIISFLKNQTSYKIGS